MVAICNIVLVGKLIGLDKRTMPRSDGRFNGAKIPLPRSTCLLFKNGAITVVGVKSLKETERIPHYLTCLFPAAALAEPLKICNMVATTNAHTTVDLKKLYELVRNDSLVTYTPETFPGMKISVRSNLVAIVFHTGKIVITGAKSTEDLAYAEDKILNIIKQII
jgi:transcription initiation factor TFIID TATA-box-binding protein